MIHSLRRLAAPCAVLLFLAGCATAPKAPSPAASASADAAITQGNLVFAAQEFERLAKSNRNQRESYLLLAAEAWRDEGEFGEVRRVLTDIKRKRLSAEQNVQLDLLLAEGLLQEGQFDQADVLLTMPESQIPKADRLRFMELKAKALAGNQRILESIEWRRRMHGLLSVAEQRDNEQAAAALLSTTKPELLVQGLAALDGVDPARPWFERALRARNLFPARPRIEPTHAVGTLLTDSSGQLRAEGHVDPGKVALLLPLSGAFATAGNAVRDGFFSAWFAAQLPWLGDVQVFDTGSDASGMPNAVAAAIAAGATTLVGPIERSQVDWLFANLPPKVRVLGLNHPDSSPIPPDAQFQFGLAPEVEAALAAERLYDTGVRRASVLVSQEDWAERAGRAFTAQFTAIGGRVIAQRSIAPDAVKFGDELDALVSTPKFVPDPDYQPRRDIDGNPVPGAAKQRMLPVMPADAAEALFASIRTAQARMLMPQLRARGQDGLIVLATSHVASQGNNPTADRDLEGISFLDAPFLYDSNTALGLNRQELSAALPAAAVSPRLFAFGVDACRLLPYLDYLKQHPGSYLEGASGQLLIDGFGRVRHLYSGYRYQNGMPMLSQSLYPASGARNLPLQAEPESLPIQTP